MDGHNRLYIKPLCRGDTVRVRDARDRMQDWVCLRAALSRRVARPADLGLSTGLYTAYGVALDVVFAAVYGAVAAAIFWRRPEDRMALFVSLALLTFGTTTFPNAASALA